MASPSRPLFLRSDEAQAAIGLCKSPPPPSSSSPIAFLKEAAPIPPPLQAAAPSPPPLQGFAASSPTPNLRSEIRGSLFSSSTSCDLKSEREPFLQVVDQALPSASSHASSPPPPSMHSSSPPAFRELVCIPRVEVEDDVSMGKGNQAESVDVGKMFTTITSFPTREEMISWARSVAKAVGFVITIQSADKITSRSKPRVLLGCDRAGSKRRSQNNWINKNMRKSSSKRCECPFSLKGTRDSSGSEWTLEVRCGVHNHEMVHLEAHSYAGRLNESEQKIVHDLYSAGVKPRKILTALKKRDSSNATCLRTLYNERAKLQKKELDGGTPIQLLYQCIKDSGYISFNKVKLDGNQLESLLFAHPISVRLCKMFSTVFILDCTYKTNRYRLPLLSIVGVTSTNITFFAAFIFMSNENEESYVWALNCFKYILDKYSLPQVLVTDREMALMNAIKVVFPQSKNLLCRVHISRNILAHCKKFFSDGKEFEIFLLEWHRVVNCNTEKDFISALQSFKNIYAQKYPAVYSYVVSTWFDPFKEYFVSAWVEKCMHLGNTTTNRVEGGHSQLKKFLEVSIGNLTTVWKTFDQLITLQHTEIKKSFGQSVIQVNKDYRGMVYSELVGRISSAALEIVRKEVLNIISGEECKHTNRYTFGLPCAHELKPYVAQGNSVPLWMVHNHWKQLQLLEDDVKDDVKVEDEFENDIDIELKAILSRYKGANVLQKQEIKRKLREIMDPASTLTVEPVVSSQLKGRPKGSNKKFQKDYISTKRELSLFEHVMQADQEKLTPTTIIRKITGKKMLQRVRKEMPSNISKYIIDVVDVLGDGHCGYRVISLALDMRENWQMVRVQLIKEMQQKESLYTEIYGISRYNEVFASLDCTSAPAPLEKWMTMPDMGLVVASCYNIRLVHFSSLQSFTFLPLYSAPPIFPRTVYIGFINGNHFVQLLVHDDCPLPPIFSSWKRYRLEIATT